MPTIFVTASSGHIGSKLIPILLPIPDAKLVLPTTNAARLLSSFPKSDTINVVEGSIQDPLWVQTQLRTHNVDTIFLCLTGIDELFTTLNFLSTLPHVPSIKHIVYLSACGDFTHATPGWMSAHATVKYLIELSLRDLCVKHGFTYTILGPTIFYTNDVRQLPSIFEQGIYQEPLGKLGASRVATDDIAEAAKVALLDQGKLWNGKKIMVGSKKRYTEDDISRIWTQALGKPVRSALSDDASLDKLELNFRAGVGPLWARDLRLMYESIRDFGFGPTEEEYAEEVLFLGREPRVYEDFVSSLVAEWKEKGPM